MATIAEFTLPARAFPLGAAFDVHSDVTLELDRVVPSGDTVMPYFWVHTPGGKLEQIRQAFDGLRELRSISLMEDLGERGLFRAEWDPEYLGIMSAIAKTDVTVLSATGSQEGWLFELRAENGEQLAEFQRQCEGEIEISLTRLSRLSAVTDWCKYGLTEEQHEALLIAHEMGYYESPRQTDLETLAGQLGISRQALSARLTRGYRNLIERTLRFEEPHNS